MNPSNTFTLCNGKKRADFVQSTSSNRYIEVHYYKKGEVPNAKGLGGYTYANSKAQIHWENLVNDGWNRIA